MPSKRQWLASRLMRGGAPWLLSRAWSWSGVLTLNYHRIGVGDVTPFERGLWSASAAAFEAQVEFLKAHFDLIAPADLPARGARQRGRLVMITFDDGYRDNFSTAYPILQRHRVPATFFVATGFIDHPRIPWWDQIAWMVRQSPRGTLDVEPWLPGPLPLDEPERQVAIDALLGVYKAQPADAAPAFLAALAQATGCGPVPPQPAADLWMNWEMLRTMRGGGMTIGGHTVNHPILARLNPEQQWEEISGCRQRLETELGVPMTCFSYPNGTPEDSNIATRACLERCGVQYAFSFYGGVAHWASWDNLNLPRVAVERDTTFDLFRATAFWPQIFGRPVGTRYNARGKRRPAARQPLMQGAFAGTSIPGLHH